MTAPDPIKARKGDLILIERVDHNYYSVAAHEEAKAAGRELPDTETTCTFGVVASATRDGQPKTWYSVGWGDELVSTGYAQPVMSRLVNRYWVQPAKQVDVEAVLHAAKAHHYPNHPGQPKPYDTFEEARDVARQHRIEEKAA
jgi:hypothetical protein